MIPASKRNGQNQGQTEGRPGWFKEEGGAAQADTATRGRGQCGPAPAGAHLPGAREDEAACPRTRRLHTQPGLSWRQDRPQGSAWDQPVPALLLLLLNLTLWKELRDKTLEMLHRISCRNELTTPRPPFLRPELEGRVHAGNAHAASGDTRFQTRSKCQMYHRPSSRRKLQTAEAIEQRGKPLNMQRLPAGHMEDTSL